MTPGYRIAAPFAALLVTAAFAPLHAAPLSVEASDNATVQAAGPRTGSNGKAFFNVEGSAAGSFASYGVADFSFGSLPFAVVSVDAAYLELIQSNAAFSATGGITFSVDQKSPLANIQPVTSPLAFDGADPGTATDVGQGDLSLLNLGGGPFAYTVGTTGDLNTYTFTLSGAAAAEMVSRLNGVQPIRIVVGTGSATVAATWAGATNSTYAGPTLHLEVTYDTGTAAKVGTWGRLKSLYR
jgi:hypothetical protein